jgi:hypothetical protein
MNRVATYEIITTELVACGTSAMSQALLGDCIAEAAAHFT